MANIIAARQLAVIHRLTSNKPTTTIANHTPNAVGRLSAAATSEGLLIAFGPFVGYALGMGTVIIAVTLGAALFRRAMARWILPSPASFSELFNTNFIERSHI